MGQCSSTNKGTTPNTAAAATDTKANQPPAVVIPSSSSQPKHVMLSYQWVNQELVNNVYTYLRSKNLPVWMDINGGMTEDIYDCMAEGVENASVVVCFLTEKYQNSKNCKKELQYTQNKNIPIVPVRLERDWKPTGWLGLVTAGLLWVDFRECNAKNYSDYAELLYRQIETVLNPSISKKAVLSPESNANDVMSHQLSVPTRKLEPNSLSSQTQPNSVNELDSLLETGNLPAVFFDLELANSTKTLNDVVKMAIDGMIDECFRSFRLTSDKACLIRDVLRKGFARDIVETTGKVDPYVTLSEEAANACIELFVKLLNKLLKQILNNLSSLQRSQIYTIGPYCWLLYRALRKNKTSDVPLVYAGLGLEETELPKYMKSEVKLTIFTLGHREREHAENYRTVFEGKLFTNTILVLDLDVKQRNFPDQNVCCGALVLPNSDFIKNEIFIMWPGVIFHFCKYEYDSTKKLHLIYLKSSDENF